MAERQRSPQLSPAGGGMEGVRGDECLTGGPLSNFSSYLIIAEWGGDGGEEEDRWKERSRMRAEAAQECVCVWGGCVWG